MNKKDKEWLFYVIAGIVVILITAYLAFYLAQRIP